MTNKEDLRVRRTYKLLSDALIELMKKKEFEKISVSDICSLAMVHRTTFYTHFTDKYDLLRYVMRKIEKPFDDIRPDITGKDGYKHFYKEAAEKTLFHIQENIGLFKIFIDKNKRESFLDIFQNDFTKKIEETLTEYEKTGIKPIAPAGLLANMYAAGCISVIIWWIENGRSISSRELLNYLDRLIAPAISAE